MIAREDMLRTAMAQSARDLNCEAGDFLKPEPVLSPGGLGPRAKRYYREPIACNFVSYGSNVVVSVRDEYRSIAEAYVNEFAFYRCFETPAICQLNDRLAPFGQQVRFMAEYWLPRTDAIKPLDCRYELRVLEPADFASLYLPEWHNALCEERKNLDMLSVGAYDGSALAGLAGCSADADDMWQIGVDVLPAYRGRGIASTLTSRLALEIFARGKVPFYCCAWSNIPSARNAIRSGFAPAWVEMTVKPKGVE